MSKSSHHKDSAGTPNPDAAPIDAILDPLADNGCAKPAGDPDEAACVMTHALVAGSPAIDAADQAFCIANGITTDQRGEDRDANCDIGAFEFIDGEACFVINSADDNTIVFCL